MEEQNTGGRKGENQGNWYYYPGKDKRVPLWEEKTMPLKEQSEDRELSWELKKCHHKLNQDWMAAPERAEEAGAVSRPGEHGEALAREHE